MNNEFDIGIGIEFALMIDGCFYTLVFCAALFRIRYYLWLVGLISCLQSSVPQLNEKAIVCLVTFVIESIFCLLAPTLTDSN